MNRRKGWLFVIVASLVFALAVFSTTGGAQPKPAKGGTKAKQTTAAKKASEKDRDKDASPIMNQDLVQQKKEFFDFCNQLMGRKHATPKPGTEKDVKYDHDNLVYTFANPKEFAEFKKKCEEKCNQGWEVYGVRTLSRSNREQVLFRKPRAESSTAKKEEKKGDTKPAASPAAKASPTQPAAKDKDKNTKPKTTASVATPIKRPFEAVQTD